MAAYQRARDNYAELVRLQVQPLPLEAPAPTWNAQQLRQFNEHFEPIIRHFQLLLRRQNEDLQELNRARFDTKLMNLEHMPERVHGAPARVFPVHFEGTESDD